MNVSFYSTLINLLYNFLKMIILEYINIFVFNIKSENIYEKLKFQTIIMGRRYEVLLVFLCFKFFKVSDWNRKLG